jgi:YidC/Oxa1 family membrane protein insertase
MSDQRNLILALVLSAAVLFGWEYFFAVPASQKAQQTTGQTATANGAATPSSGAQPAQATGAARKLPRAQALALSSGRVPIMTPTLDGSINLEGARFDDLNLRQYRETTDPNSPEITLLSPLAAERPYFADFGWIAPQGTNEPVPGADTHWRVVSGDTLSPGHDVTLAYDNGAGLVFTRQISVDTQYMFTIHDKVENRGTGSAVLYPFGLVSRHNVPETKRYWVVHEGFLGVADGKLQDPSYSDLAKKNETRSFGSTGGWVGITDKYWMATVIPPQDDSFTGTYKAYDDAGVKAYQSDYLLKPVVIAAGASQEITQRLFAGAKVVGIVDAYRDNLKITRFDLAVDWGWFFFLTKPMFLALDWVYHYVGNFGIAILIFTVFVQLLFYPLANTSFRAMSKMKKLQPEMERLKALHKDDAAAQQQAVMQLYQKEKVNPVAGCLPTLIQLPVFFSLYKVLFVTIEMRHAPFFGWIKDLSAPDPLSLFNLFGLIPIALPSFLLIGVFPILMGFTMWIQTNLNPPVSDPMQAKIFQWMPVIFTLMLAGFPVGLVIYWTWKNLLSIIQQVIIMKRTGTPVDLLHRIWHNKRAKQLPPP